MNQLILAILALASSEATQADSSPPRFLYCYRELRLGRPPFGSASLVVDRSHRPVSRFLKVGGRGLRITWAFSTSTFDISITPEQLELGTVELPLGTEFPVTASVEFDGREVWRHVFERPTSSVMVIAPPAAQPRPRAFFQPGVDLTIRSRELPSLLGVRNANLLVTSSDREVRVARTHELPDWTLIQTEATRVAAELEADRVGGRCRPPSPPVA